MDAPTSVTWCGQGGAQRAMKASACTYCAAGLCPPQQLAATPLQQQPAKRVKIA